MEELDFTALEQPITRADVAAFKQFRTARSGGSYTWVKWVLWPIAAVALLALILIASAMGDESVIGAILVLALPLVAGLLIWIGVSWSTRNKAKLYKFATQNQLQYRSNASDLGYQGMIFNAGHSRVLRDALVFPGGVEVGNYQYVTGSGKSQQTHNWAYARLALQRRLPHMVLDAKSNNFWKFSNLSTAFDTSQTLALEGDFNNYFTLYVPKQYERDALYVFTPDVMKAMVEYGKDYDIEVVDDQLFLYKNGSFALDQPSFYQDMGKIVSTIHNEILDQSDYYADERIGDRSQNIIAPEGARLKSGVSWIVVVIIVAIVYFNFIHPIIMSLID